MKNWQEDQDVTVVYPGGKIKNGTIARRFPNRTYCVIFRDGEAESADPHVPESYLRAPGVQMEASLRQGCDD